MSELVALLPLAGLLLAGVAVAAPGLWWLDRRTLRQPTVDVGLTLVHEQMRPVRRRPRRYRGKRRRMDAKAVPTPTPAQPPPRWATRPTVAVQVIDPPARGVAHVGQVQS